MASLDALINGLEAVADTLQLTTSMILVKNEDEIKQVLQYRLMNSGEDANGNLIGGGQYSPVTIRHKLFTNQETGHFTLFDEGNFHKGMFVKLVKDLALIGSKELHNDNPKGSLTDRYGEAILGLTEDETDQVIKLWVDPELQKEINKMLPKVIKI